MSKLPTEKNAKKQKHGQHRFISCQLIVA